MPICLNQYLCQIQGAHLIESTIAKSRANLAEFGAQDVHYLAQGAELEGLRSDAEYHIVHIEELLLSQIRCGQEFVNC